MATEKICFEFDNSPEANQCIYWINKNTELGKGHYYGGQLNCFYTSDGHYSHRTNDPTIKHYRLVSPAEFMRIVTGESEPKWKVGDECEYDGIDKVRRGKIIGIHGEYVWVSIPETGFPPVIRIEAIRPVRKSLREELNEIVKDWLLSENQYDLADRIIEFVKERKDEL